MVLVDLEKLLRGLEDLVNRAASAAPQPTAVPAEPWLTIADAAAYAAVSEDTIREWIRLELLPCGRAGRVIRVRRSAIDVLLLSGTPTPSSGMIENDNDRAVEIMRELRGKGDG